MERSGRPLSYLTPALRLVRDEPDHVVRLDAFREPHPGVAIGADDGWWQASITAANRERVAMRYVLRALLDKLDELTNGKPGS